MSDKVIVSKSEIKALKLTVSQCVNSRECKTYNMAIDAVLSLLDQATPVSGEAILYCTPDWKQIAEVMGGATLCTLEITDLHKIPLFTTPQPAPQIKDFDLAYTCKRIRRLLKLLSIPDPSPDNDEVLLGCLFSLLGTACGIIERQQPAPDTVPVEKFNKLLEACELYEEACSYNDATPTFNRLIKKANALKSEAKGE